MPLMTKEVFERAEKKLDEKIGAHGYHCSVCGGVKHTLQPNTFSIPDVPLETSIILGGIVSIGAVFIDLMFTTCDNCGHVDFFNAHTLRAFGEE